MSRYCTINGTQITITKNKDELDLLAADLILDRIKKKPTLNLLLPTGTTPEGVYAILGLHDPKLFRRLKFFNKDEYCEKIGNRYKLVDPENSKGYRYYMWKHFFEKIRPVTSYFPNEDDIEKPGSFDLLIKRSGGLDLALSAMGEDGHLGFNFPGALFDSVTRMVKLNSNIKRVNRKLTGYKIPSYGVTIGLKTEMSAREIIFLVSGKRKARILKKVLMAGKAVPKIPATILKSHPNCHFIADEEAVSLLECPIIKPMNDRTVEHLKALSCR